MKAVLSRLKELLIKLMSIKGSVFIICTIFLFFGKIGPVTWAIFASVLIGVRSVEKAIFAWSGQIKTVEDKKVEGFK